MVVDPNYLAHPDDVSNLAHSLNESIQMMATTAFKKINTVPVSPIVDECRKFGLWTGEVTSCTFEPSTLITLVSAVHRELES